jgi:hypothetical protein
MPANIAAQAGEGQINLFEIESNYGRPKLDLSGGIVALDYYESILENEISAYATFVDTGYRKDREGYSVNEEKGIKLTTGERINLKITDGYRTTLSFLDDRHFRIRIPEGLSGTTNKLTFNTVLFTKESVDNELSENRVVRHYDGKVSDIVEKILTEVLKTPKKLNIEETLNTTSIVPTNTKPFYQCTWLGPRAVPILPNAKGNLAGFFFYETYDGFNFRSIDKLFQQLPKRKLIFNNLIEGSPPPGYDAKILEPPYFSSALDLKNILQTGSHLKTTLKGFNTYESSYRRNEFDSKEQFNISNIGGKEKPAIATELNLEERSSRISIKVDNQGAIVEGKSLKDQLPKSTFVTYNNDEILRQSYMRYNNLFSIKMSIVIPGDFELRAGDLLHCDLPEISGVTSKEVSRKVSGIYMIVDLCHHITKNNCYTRVNLVRESIGRKSF